MPEEQPIVSDLVLAVLDASAAALSCHYGKMFQHAENFQDEFKIAKRLEKGWDQDLQDHDPNQARDKYIGFSHKEIAKIFHNNLSKMFKGRGKERVPRGVDRHIWSADYDWQIRSLFPTGAAYRPRDGEQSGASTFNRTRVSAVVQQALLRNRRVLQSQKATTALRRSEISDACVFAPSPFYIAQRILTDPDAPWSEAYANGALRVELMRRLSNTLGPIELTHDKVRGALDLIANRSSTSKPILSGADPGSRGASLYICHYLAMRGLFSLEFKWAADQRDSRVDKLFTQLDNLFDVKMRDETVRGFGRQVGFRMHPDQIELPDSAELLNELQGLPLPLEGVSEIFQGGLRFGSRGDIVAAVSGRFGVGKTSACLALASALAPFGSRTLFLSCEESQEDIEARMLEAAPEFIARTTPLFRCASLDQFRKAANLSTWFAAHKLRFTGASASDLNIVSEVGTHIDDAVKAASVFDVFHDPEQKKGLPPFAKQIIVVDGFHQLFRETSLPSAVIERSLRELIERCKELGAVFLFTVAENEPETHRLDYLCDVVVELARHGEDMPNEAATRLFKVTKARRQPTLRGAHVLHLGGEKSLRVKLNASARAELAKSSRWFEPMHQRRLWLGDGKPVFGIYNRSQVLVFGKGSSGKAGLGLYILNRRPLSKHLALGTNVSTLFDRDKTKPDLDLIDQNIETDDNANDFYEARTLVISFLYDAQYYRTLQRRFPHRSADRGLVPSSSEIDVLSLYPGNLTPEALLAKVENRLKWAELRGIPFTGVMVDGIHNVFVQFPALEAETTFWPQLFNILRRRPLNVVTTHTEFELHTSDPNRLAFDFEHAQKKAAPLLSALISASDYVFELSGSHDSAQQTQYRLRIRSALGEEPPPGFGIWDRKRCRLGRWQEQQLSLAEFS